MDLHSHIRNFPCRGVFFSFLFYFVGEINPCQRKLTYTYTHTQSPIHTHPQPPIQMANKQPNLSEKRASSLGEIPPSGLPRCWRACESPNRNGAGFGGEFGGVGVEWDNFSFNLLCNIFAVRCRGNCNGIKPTTKKKSLKRTTAKDVSTHRTAGTEATEGRAWMWNGKWN